MLDIEFSSIDEGKEKLKKAIGIRDSMGGVLYFNICNDDCAELANKLVVAGADREEISAIIGSGMTGLE
jgi:hypothetical protein